MACGDRAGQARRSRAARAAGGRAPVRNSNTGGGSRTHTGVSAQRILSPQRLPFRHAGSCGEVSTGRRCHKRKEPSRPGRFVIGAGPIRRRSDRSGRTPIHDPARTSPPLPRHSSPATNLLGKSKACNRSTWAVRARRSPTGPWSQWCRGAHRATSRLARSIWTFLFGHGGGGGGIRTHGQAEPVNGFQDRPDQPLWHPSGSSDKRQMTNGRWQIANDRWQIAKGSAGSGRAARARVVHWPTSSMMSSAT